MWRCGGLSASRKRNTTMSPWAQVNIQHLSSVGYHLRGAGTSFKMIVCVCDLWRLSWAAGGSLEFLTAWLMHWNPLPSDSSCDSVSVSCLCLSPAEAEIAPLYKRPVSEKTKSQCPWGLALKGFIGIKQAIMRSSHDSEVIRIQPMCP